MKLTDFRQTPFVTAENFNKAYFEFEEFEEGARIEVLGAKIIAEAEKMYALVPCVETETLTAVTLHLPDGSFVSYTYNIKPVGKTEICLLNLSGGGEPYSDYCIISKKDNDYTEKAAEICEELPDFRYALNTPGTSAEKYLKSCQIEALADISALCTAAACGEDIAERLKRSQNCSVKPQTAFIGRASGLSLGAVSYLAEAGIKYVIISPKPFRNSDTHFAAELFRLRCGSEAVIVYIDKNDSTVLPKYEKSSLPLSAASELVEYKLFLKSKGLSETEEKAEKFLGKKAIAPIIFEGEPNVFLRALCDEMTSKWKYPLFNMSTPSEFMKKLTESCGENIPEISGEISCPCADDLTGFGKATAEKRKFSYELQTANAFSLIKAAENLQNKYPKSEFSETASEISEFAVQNIDFTAKNPIEMHRFNMFYKKVRPLINAKRLTENSFAKFIDRQTEGFVTAINQTLRERKFSLISPVPLEGILCQKTDGGYLTEPVMLPAFGAKSFVCGTFKEGSPFADVKGDIIDTGHYRISIDSKTGRIKSIVENTAMRELLDLQSDVFLGDMIYTAGSGENINLNIQKCIDFRIENGPLAVKIIRRGIEEQSRAEVFCTVTFYKFSKNIDVNLKFVNAFSLSGDFYDRYEKNIFFAFPLRCEDYRFKSTHPTGEICESKDRLPIGIGDFAVCQRYAVVENNYCGTMAVCREMPVFHFGKIQYGSFSPQPSCTAAHMYLYAASNRANQLVYQNSDNCSGEFSLTLLPYRTSAADEVSAAADSFLHPPKIVNGYSVERSRMSVSEEGIIFGSLKLADDGAFLLRMTETLGLQRRLVISVPFKISKAFRADLFGTAKEELTEISANMITVNADKNAPLTLRLYPSRDYRITESESCGLRYYSYTAHCGKAVAVWDKCGDNSKEKYEIFCDGEKIAEVKAQNSETQIYMTDASGAHKIEVK